MHVSTCDAVTVNKITQLMAPDFIALEERDKGGVKVKDFPAGAITKLKSLGDSIFTEFVFHKSHAFAED